MSDEEPDSAPLGDLVALGSDLVGGGAGAGLGFLLGGGPGAVGGQVIGVAASFALRRVAAEIKQRWLSKREEIRVGGLLASAVMEFNRRAERGEKLRDDGFFDPQADRSVAEELIEHALLVARDEAEERKVELLGRLTAAICFDETVSREQGNNLIRTAEHLSYRQIIMLKFFVTSTPHPGLRASDYMKQTNFSLEMIHALDEVHSLMRQGLLTNGQTIALGLTDIIPSSVKTQGVGVQMFNLMRLGDVSEHVVQGNLSILFAA
jgi:hypothetical protein